MPSRRSRHLRAWYAGLLLAAGGSAGTSIADVPTVIRVDAPSPGARIDRDIFGQFAEHLGTGIYGGVWVGKDSPIPNVRGIRSDVAAALRALKVPVVRWPGGCFADEYHWRDDPNRTADIAVEVTGSTVRQVSGQVLAAAHIDSVNSFDAPATVSPKPVEATRRSGSLALTLPPASVAVVALQL